MKTLYFLFFLSLPAAAAGVVYQPGVLHQIRQEAWTRSQKHPVGAVFDVDDTLIDTRFRTLRILTAWAEAQNNGPLQAEAEKLRGLEPADVPYNLSDLLTRRGITDPQVATAIESFWAQHFFNNDFCGEDQEIPDAGAYLRSLQKLHADIFYVTGRIQAQMRDCTLQSFQRLGFPLGLHAHLIMRSDPMQDEFSYKQQVFATIRQESDVIAAFENEPRNVNLEQASFPGAFIVFLDTIHSDAPVTPNSGIAWIENFQP
jgi:hypothetical protein